MNKAIKISHAVVAGNRVIPNIQIIDAPQDDKNLEFLYKNIECDTFDVAYFKDVDFWVDDNGLITSGKIVCEYTYDDYTVPLAGNIVVSKSADNLGRTVWFDVDKDMDLMMKVIDTLENAELKGMTNVPRKEIF